MTIRFTYIGQDKDGQDIIAIGEKADHVAVGEGLLAYLREHPRFQEAEQLPDERPVHKAA